MKQTTKYISMTASVKYCWSNMLSSRQGFSKQVHFISTKEIYTESLLSPPELIKNVNAYEIICKQDKYGNMVP
jgi:hypothetical protein